MSSYIYTVVPDPKSGKDYYYKDGSDYKKGTLKAPTKSKTSSRRKSFCARMSGMKGPMKDEKGRPTRKALSLRKWDC